MLNYKQEVKKIQKITNMYTNKSWFKIFISRFIWCKSVQNIIKLELFTLILFYLSLICLGFNGFLVESNFTIF